MRYGIFSDVHANLEALERVLGAYKSESIDKYICVGDIVGYAANPQECIDKVRSLCMVSVAGNHDWASIGFTPLDYFNPLAKEAVLWTSRKLNEHARACLESLKLIYTNEDLTVVHGTLDSPGDFNYMNDGYAARQTFAILERDICFVGHTHVAGFFIREENGGVSYRQDVHINIEKRKKYIVNTGSVGQPRDGNPSSAYCIYDTAEKELYIKRIDYDIQSARDKIKQAGLPQFLGDRLLLGR